MNLQWLVVAVCVLAAALYLLRTARRRWSARRAAAAAEPLPPGQVSACGGCRGCGQGTEGSGCH
jgi:hypothetical protein